MRHRVPLAITSLGIVPEVISAVRSYGGLVFHDVTNLRHAVTAVEGGVDGLIAVWAGAGGHAGRLSPFALLPELRAPFAGPLLMGGAISTGRRCARRRRCWMRRSDATRCPHAASRQAGS